MRNNYILQIYPSIYNLPKFKTDRSLDRTTLGHGTIIDTLRSEARFLVLSVLFRQTRSCVIKLGIEGQLGFRSLRIEDLWLTEVEGPGSLDTNVSFNALVKYVLGFAASGTKSNETILDW